MSPVHIAVLAALGGALAGVAVAAALLGATLAHSRRHMRAARHLLHHDLLTGLASRYAALAHLDRARRRGRPLAVALLDLDRFKAVNDTFGHPAGDDVLRQIAGRLARLPPAVRLAARLHGDEFLLIIDGDAGAAHTAAHTAWQAIAGTPLHVAGHRVGITASVGVAATDAGTHHDDLLVHADKAMYQAKTSGTGVHLHVRDQHPPAAGERPRRRYRDRPATSPAERTPPVTTDLYFDLASALRLAEHAVAARTHEPSYSEHDDGLACPGALVWDDDDGTYLMSGGRPPQLADPDDPTSNVVVHAHGFGPGSDRHLLGGTDVGFDDFAEHLHLTDGDPPLIDLLRGAATRGYRWLILRVDGDTVTTRVSRTGPADQPT